MSSTASYNSEVKPQHNNDAKSGRVMTKRKRHLSRDYARENPDGRNSVTKRRYSTKKALRDPRDEAALPSPKKVLKPDREETKSVIDFDGLSRPSTASVPFPAIYDRNSFFFKALAPGQDSSSLPRKT